MATPIITRSGKGAALTWVEVDTDFTTLRDTIDSNSASLGASLATLQASQGAGVMGFQTKALMDANLTPTNNTLAMVTNDVTTTNNTFWIKSGASGTGSWIKSGIPSNIPFINASLYADFATAISAQGAAKATVVVSTNMPVTTVVAKPENVDLMFVGAGVLTLSGSGAVTGLKEARPEWFGAKRDGTTDDAAAIDSAIASLSAGGLLQLEAGTYIAGTFSTRTGAASSLFVPKSNITIQGRGDATVIKAKSGLSPGEWSFFRTTTELLQNCIFRDFKLDGGDNLNGATARTNRFIGSDAGGYNILIDNITLTNGPGNNPVAFSGTTGTRGMITVNNCRFTEMGSGKPDNVCADHSDIYLVGSNNKITNNYFKSTEHVVGAAMEFHGDLGEAYGNFVSGYDIPFYIAPNGQTFTKTSVHHNTFNDVLAFGFLAPDGTGILGDIFINNNTFNRIASATPGYGFAGSDIQAEPAGTISITNNSFIGNDGDDCYAMHVGYAKNISIQNNYVSGFYQGVQLNATGDTWGDTYTHHIVNICNNSFVGNENYNIQQSSASAKVKSLVVSGNSFHANSSMAFGAFAFSGTVDQGKISGNEIYNYNMGHVIPANVSTDYLWIQTFTIDPTSLAPGALYSYNAVMIGITLPGQVLVVPPYDMQSVAINAYIQSANNVIVQFRNNGAGTIDLASGSFKIMIMR